MGRWYLYLFYGNASSRLSDSRFNGDFATDSRGAHWKKKKFMTLSPSDRFCSNLSANTRLAICEISRGAYNEIVINLPR